MVSFRIRSSNDNSSGIPRHIWNFHVFFWEKVKVFKRICESGLSFEESGLFIFAIVGVFGQIFWELLLHKWWDFSEELRQFFYSFFWLTFLIFVFLTMVVILFGRLHVVESVFPSHQIWIDLHSELLFLGIVDESFNRNAFHFEFICVHSHLVAAFTLSRPNSSLLTDSTWKFEILRCHRDLIAFSCIDL